MQRRSILQALLVAPVVAFLRRLGLMKPNAWVDGKDEYVTVGSVEDFRFDRSEPFTLSFWFKTGGRPGDAKIVTPKTSVEVNLDQFNDGRWHHLVLPKLRERS